MYLRHSVHFILDLWCHYNCSSNEAKFFCRPASNMLCCLTSIVMLAVLFTMADDAQAREARRSWLDRLENGSGGSAAEAGAAAADPVASPSSDPSVIMPASHDPPSAAAGPSSVATLAPHPPIYITISE